jgi:hypothetical protein
MAYRSLVGAANLRSCSLRPSAAGNRGGSLKSFPPARRLPIALTDSRNAREWIHPAGTCG